MKNKQLRMKCMTKAILIGLLLGMAGMMEGYAQQEFIVGDLIYNLGIFDDVSVKGHVDGVNATGALLIPPTVTYNGVTRPVNSIFDNAFHNCDKLTSVIIGDGIRTIGSTAFQNCTGITSVILPNSIKYIDPGAFEYCNNLTHITIPNQVTTIEGRTFSGCSNLSSVTIGKSVTTISYLAFSGCTELSAITILAETPPTFQLAGQSSSTYAFYDVSEDIPIYVPNNTIQNYSSASYWHRFTNYQLVSIYAGNINNNWNVASNWNPAIIPSAASSVVIDEDFSGNLVELDENVTVSYLSIMNDKTLTIKSNRILNVSGALSNNSSEDNIIIENDAQLYTMSEGVQATVKKSITAHNGSGGWNFIASPITTNIIPSTDNGFVSSISENYDLYFYDEPAHYWRNYKESDNSLFSGFSIEPKKGYLYANGVGTTLSFAGTLQSGATITSNTLSYEAEDLEGWNLVGNPFPCNAYANKSYYTMNEDGTAIEPVAVSTETAIPACTGVMVKAENTGESVTFSKTAPTAASNNGLLQIAVAQSNMRGAVVQDKAVVSFNAGDELGKFYFGESNAKLYIPQNGKEYAIATAAKTGELLLNFKATKNGEYTISVNTENVELDYLHLIDNLTGADIDLLSPAGFPLCKGGQGDYTFAAKTTDYASRFKLVFSANESDGDNAFAFINNGNIIVYGEGTLQVIDMTGRVVRTVGLSQCGSRATTNGIMPGVYVLRLINGDNVMTQKIVVE